MEDLRVGLGMPPYLLNEGEVMKMMVSEAQIRNIIGQVLKEIDTNKDEEKAAGKINANPNIENYEELVDITEIELKNQVFVPGEDKVQVLLKMKEKTPARIGVWRAGPRYKTETMIRFQADHAAARDAVFSDVNEEFIRKLNLMSLKTKCKDRDEHLTRPDLGKIIEDAGVGLIKDKCIMAPQVQIYISDGLSSTAVETNAGEVLLVLSQGLKNYGISIGTPFFLKYGRVAAMDQVSEILKPEVTCVLIGERPGLITAESMSAYLVYKGKIGIPEANRNLISNIHKGGTPAVEAGAYLVDLIKLMLDRKSSGLNLKL